MPGQAPLRQLRAVPEAVRPAGDAYGRRSLARRPSVGPAPAPGSILRPEELVQLQTLVGNHAVRGLVRDSGPSIHHSRPTSEPTVVVQRDYLDQHDKTGSFSAATEGENGETDRLLIKNVVLAIDRYQAANQGVARASSLTKALQEIYELAAGGLSGASSTLAKVLNHLMQECTIVLTDLATAEMLSETAEAIKPGEWNSEHIAQAMAELRRRQGKYDPKLGVRGKSPQQGVFAVFADAIRAVAKVESAQTEKLGEERYKFGDPDTGKIDPDIQKALDDFRHVEAFLGEKQLVLEHLRPLAQAVDESEDKLAGLKAELSRKESEAGFQPPQIPLGILPSEVFLSLLQSGTILDDFGAGLQHGELSHRIQWYALIDYMNSESGITWNFKPAELFKKINSPPFSPDRTGNSMWGTLFDKGTSASAKSYNAPGTLNRDLLESAPNFKPEGPGLAERDRTYEKPDTSGLESIGAALLQLRELRIEQANRAIKRSGSSKSEPGKLPEERALEEKSWTAYGLPPRHLVQEIENEYERASFTVASEGEFNDSSAFSSSPGKRNRWKVLKATS